MLTLSLCKRIDKISCFRQITKLLNSSLRVSSATLLETKLRKKYGPRPQDYINMKKTHENLKGSKGLSQFYNPAIVRAFEEFQIQDTSNGDLLEMFRCAQDFLISLDSDIFWYKEQMSKNDDRAIANRMFSDKVQNDRRTAGDTSSKVLANIKTDKELIALSSFMAILMPMSERVWSEFDRDLSSRLDKFSLDSSLIAVHAMIATKSNLRLDSRFSSPHLVAEKIYSTIKLSLLHENGVENSPSVDMHPVSTDSLQCVRSRLFEQIALYLQILSVVKPEVPYKYGIVQNPNPDAKNLEKVSEWLINSLSTIKEPINFLSFRMIWESASLLNLPNSYQVYKVLYDQIHRSIMTEPMQIIDQEEAIYSLLESMKVAKFKNGKLVKEICNLLDTHGFNIVNYGMKLFGILVELDAVTFASKILTRIINEPNITVIFINVCIYTNVYSSGIRHYALSCTDLPDALNISLYLLTHIETQLEAIRDFFYMHYGLECISKLIFGCLSMRKHHNDNSDDF